MDSAVATSEPEETVNSTEGSTVENVPEPQQAAQNQSNHNQDDKTANASDDFAAALESFTTESEEAAGEDMVLKGTVLKITATHVVVDIGAKSEGMLPLSEVLDHEGNSRFKPGDEIDVMREKGPAEEGYINLSHQKAQRLRAWDEIERAHNEKRPIKAQVIERIKGGVTVDILGARAFLAGIASRPAAGAESGRAEGTDPRSCHHQAEQEARQHCGLAQGDSGRRTEPEEVADAGASGRRRDPHRSGKEPYRVRRLC